jgi:hypothetical protein
MKKPTLTVIVCAGILCAVSGTIVLSQRQIVPSQGKTSEDKRGKVDFRTGAPNDEDHSVATLCCPGISGKWYRFAVKKDILHESPDWTDDTCPQCAPKAAETLAYNWIRDRLPEWNIDGTEWSCQEISLTHFEDSKWFWVVNFRLTINRGGASGQWPDFSVPVLLNGIIPEPIIETIAIDEDGNVQ